MKNIPMFMTDDGVASLILEEIPYKKEAYIKIQSSTTPEKLLEETVSFCKAVGAETVYASGHAYLDRYPFHTEIIQMECNKKLLQRACAELRPLQEDMLQQWCEIYNTNMRSVPNASTMTYEKSKKLLRDKDCYCVYDNEQLLGIGKASSGKVDAIVSLIRGRGTDVMLAICGVLSGSTVAVEVATNNIPAIKLYQKLGFVETKKISKWYCVSRKNT